MGALNEGRCADGAWFVVVLSVVALAILVSANSAVADLPEGRVYEQVSPEFKAGYPVFALPGASGFALDGEDFRFNSIGAFSYSGENPALNPYLARRTEHGWSTSGLLPVATGQCWAGPQEMSPDLSRFGFLVSSGDNAVGCSKSPTNTVWTMGADGSATIGSPAMTTISGEVTGPADVGASLDLSRSIVANPQDMPEYHLAPQPCAEGFVDERLTGEELFEVEECGLRLVGVDESGQQISLYCPTKLGGPAGAFGAVSEPGALEIFFSVGIDSQTPQADQCPDEAVTPIQLFARVNGERTLTVSAPLSSNCTENPCKAAAAAGAMPKDAIFEGASEDGSKVFFTTTQPLVNEDKDAASDLYMAVIGCPGGSGEACGDAQREVTSLTRLTADPHTGSAADVRGVLALSPDGSHVYFVASGDLLAEAQEEALVNEGRSVPHAGAENFYVYDTASGVTSFIADLCSEAEKSGIVIDAQCPSNLAGGDGPGVSNDSGLWTTGRDDHEAQTTPSGGALVFSSYGQLIPSGPERDADTAKDVYIYDAGAGRLRRVSVGEAGLDANGNDDKFDATIAATSFRGPLQNQYEMETRAVSEDGSTVVFSTAAPLSLAATNTRRDVYTWHEGEIGLISSGAGTEPDQAFGITPSGRDVFFLTSVGLVSGDTDGLADVYDARAGGGFPEPPAVREPCSGDACQGPLSTPAAVLVPGSLSQAGGGNVVPKPKPKPKPKHKHKPVHRRKTKAKKGAHATRRHNAAVGGRGR